MDAGLRGWAANDADGLAGPLARARVGLGALATNGQAAQVADAAIALDALQSLEVHADLAAKVALDNVFPVLNRMNDLGKLLLGEVLGADGRIDVGLGEDVYRVTRADAVNIT